MVVNVSFVSRDNRKAATTALDFTFSQAILSQTWQKPQTLLETGRDDKAHAIPFFGGVRFLDEIQRKPLELYMSDLPSLVLCKQPIWC